jgi:hypothetical protein
MTTTAASPLLDRSRPERLSSLLRWANPVRAARRPSLEMTHRLAAAIIEQRSLLAAPPAEPGHEALRSELRRSLDLAEAHNQKHEMLEGWQTVYVVREAAVFLCGDEELACHAIALREQARDNLSDGRLRAVEALLGDAPSATAVSTAQRVVDDHFKGMHMRAAQARVQLFFLPIVLGLALGLLFFASTLLVIPDGWATTFGNPAGLAWIYVCGALGALLSVTLGTMRGVTRENFLVMIGPRVNITRPLLGAASAAAVVAILETNFLNLSLSGARDRPLTLAVALAAGFSERLLTNALTAVVRGSDPK